MSEPNEEIRLAVLRGRADERERIIKLLEERKCGCYCEVHMVLDPAIAAIKGEK